MRESLQEANTAQEDERARGTGLVLLWVEFR